MKSPNFSINVQSIYDWYRETIRNPKYRWWVILGTLAYILSPIDILPDVIPIVGQLDDVVLFTLLVSEVSQLLIDRVKTVSSKNASSVDSTANPNATQAGTADVNATVTNSPVEVKAVEVE
jgi:uncharacterized membrane protein YkvA (DUF1232 family)